MTASSVTGVGPGISNGKQKPQNHGSCPCSSKTKEQIGTNIIKKNECYVNHKIC